uniref:Uncharacterized protein n=1 Tax=Heterorhabditis bacteriophora TaxID=37862 RepID=A0A1I7X2Q5_HETBA
MYVLQTTQVLHLFRSQQIFFFFKFPYCLLWIGTALLICFNWEFSISYFLRSNEEMKIYLRQPFFSEYGRDIDNEVFYGVLYYVNDEGTIHFRWYYCAFYTILVCMFGSFAMSFYPVIDPLICIYYFKDYRRAVLSILKAFKSTQQKPGNVGEFRSTTAY